MLLNLIFLKLSNNQFFLPLEQLLNDRTVIAKFYCPDIIDHMIMLALTKWH